MTRVVRNPRIADFDAGMAASLGVQALFMLDPLTGSLWDLITAQKITISSIGTGVSEEGSVLTFAGGSSQILRWTGLNATLKSGALDQFVVCARIKATAAQAANPGAFFALCDNAFDQSGVGVGFDNNAAPKPSGLVLGGNGAFVISPTSGVLNTFYTVYCNGAISAQAAKAWVNGAITSTTNNSGGTTSAHNEITFGGVSRSAGAFRYGTGQMLWGAILKRSLPASGAAAFSNNDAWALYGADFPYNLFRTSRRSYAGAAVALSPARKYLYQQAVNRASTY